MRLSLVMKTQHEKIDTASDLRDLIAQSPQEAKSSELSCVKIRHEDLAEMRLLILRLQNDISYVEGMALETKIDIKNRAEKILDKTNWFKVKFVD